jgi:hypothetical protein
MLLLLTLLLLAQLRHAVFGTDTFHVTAETMLFTCTVTHCHSVLQHGACSYMLDCDAHVYSKVLAKHMRHVTTTQPGLTSILVPGLSSHVHHLPPKCQA